MKKIFLIIILFVVIITCTYTMLYKYRIDDNLKTMQPFSKNNTLLKIDTGFKVTGNIPKIEAASAFYPFAANLVQNIYDELAYSKEMLKLVSISQAYLDIINGKTDIIIATKPSDEQNEMIKKSNINLEFKTIYLEPLVILINKSNSINNLRIEQIQDIYYGNNLNWNTYQLEKNNGSQTCFESIVKNNKLGKNHKEINTMPKIIDKVASDEKAMGYAFYSYYSKMHTNNNVRIINVNNKEFNDIDYPLLFEVYLIYRNDNNNENISKIVNWFETIEGQEFKDYVCGKLDISS